MAYPLHHRGMQLSLPQVRLPAQSELLKINIIMIILSSLLKTHIIGF